MSAEASDLLKRALALPAEERAALANTLLDSLKERASLSRRRETMRSHAASRISIKAGRAISVPWDQLHRELLNLADER